MKFLLQIFVFGIVLVGTAVFSHAEDAVRDPFSSLLPSQEQLQQQQLLSRQLTPQKEPEAPQIVVQGILWGTSMPQAIIDGSVYKEGDILIDDDAEITIYQIQADQIIVEKEGRMFTMRVGREEQ